MGFRARLAQPNIGQASIWARSGLWANYIGPTSTLTISIGLAQDQIDASQGDLVTDFLHRDVRLPILTSLLHILFFFDIL